MEQDEELEQLMAEAQMRKAMPCPDIDHEWERLSERLSRRHRGARVRPKLYMRALKGTVAAAAVLIIAVFIMWKAYDKGNNVLYEAKTELREVEIISQMSASESEDAGKSSLSPDNKMVTVSVPQGKDHKITLPDGSQVWLNAQSRLTYPENFDGKRTVELEGEAYFSVVHDKDVPFIVVSGEMYTEVMGTEFNVRNYGKAGADITLIKGMIKVKAQEKAGGTSTEAILDIPGNNASLTDEGDIEIKEVNIDDVICWTEGLVFFDDAPLQDILVQMGSWYDMSVICRGDCNLSKRFHYIYDRNKKAEDVASALSELANVSIKIENNNIFVE